MSPRYTDAYTPEQLAGAVRALGSSLGKCRKARGRLKEGSPQQGWVDRQLEAYSLGIALMENAPHDGLSSPEALKSAATTYAHLITRCQELPEKFANAPAQRTLALRRLEAFFMAAALIGTRLGDLEEG